jgi:hypothetical protein
LALLLGQSGQLVLVLVLWQPREGKQKMQVEEPGWMILLLVLGCC